MTSYIHKNGISTAVKHNMPTLSKAVVENIVKIDFI